MISLHGEVPGNSDIFEIHDVIDRIEKELNQKLGCEAVIHMDPIEVNNEKVAEIRRILALKIAERLEGVTPSMICGWYRGRLIRIWSLMQWFPMASTGPMPR